MSSSIEFLRLFLRLLLTPVLCEVNFDLFFNRLVFEKLKEIPGGLFIVGAGLDVRGSKEGMSEDFFNGRP